MEENTPLPIAPHITDHERFLRRECGVQAIMQGLCDGKSPRQLVFAVAESSQVSRKTGWQWYKIAQVRLAEEFDRQQGNKKTLGQIAIEKRLKYVSDIFDWLEETDEDGKQKNKKQYLAAMKQIMDIEKDLCALLGLYPDKNVNIRTEVKGDGQDVSIDSIREALEKIRRLSNPTRDGLEDGRGPSIDAEFHVMDDAGLSGELASPGTMPSPGQDV